MKTSAETWWNVVDESWDTRLLSDADSGRWAVSIGRTGEKWAYSGPVAARMAFETWDGQGPPPAGNFVHAKERL